jgi:chromosome partitioning protein
MATLDRQLAGRDGMGLVLRRALEALAGRFDHVLLDCPPTMGVLMVNALAAAEHLLVPVQTEFLALKGLERMERTLAMIRRAGRAPRDHLIVPTMYDKRTRASRESIQALRRDHGQHLWPGIVPVDTRFREASRAGMPLDALHPGARGVRAYRKLLDYALGRWAPAPEGASGAAAAARLRAGVQA